MRELTFAASAFTCQHMEMTRIRKPVSITPDPKVLARLDDWIARQEAPWNRTKIIDLAVAAWLDRKEEGDND